MLENTRQCFAPKLLKLGNLHSNYVNLSFESRLEAAILAHRADLLAGLKTFCINSV